MGHLLHSVTFSQAMIRHAVLCQQDPGQENIQTESETAILANNDVNFAESSSWKEYCFNAKFTGHFMKYLILKLFHYLFNCHLRKMTGAHIKKR